VVFVTWNDARAFCDWLSKKEGKQYRLPTEAEWEYACRAGSPSRFHFGNDEAELGQYAWYSENSKGQTHPVGQKKANAFGLHDMHGNVWQWCADWYDSAYYQNSPKEDPQGPNTAGASRVIRGGSWDDSPRLCRSAYRPCDAPSSRLSDLGFRVVCLR
jgi:formylglycine-generating enzyme required for sulfatase activity